ARLGSAWCRTREKQISKRLTFLTDWGEHCRLFSLLRHPPLAKRTALKHFLKCFMRLENSGKDFRPFLHTRLLPLSGAQCCRSTNHRSWHPTLHTPAPHR
ncbi:hypothetical protein J4Q44_G00211300, partial [Coregonus suidteri]